MNDCFKNKTILVVDDDPTNCGLIETALIKKGVEVRIAHNGIEAQKVLNSWKPDLVLLDQDMPKMNGLELLRWMRSQSFEMDVAFISASGSAQSVKAALDSGANDYIRKPFSFQELISRIGVRFRITDLVRELEKANKQLKSLSEHDDVTGLYNMRSMYERIDHEIKRSNRNKKPVSCIMLDMDHFKEVNDNHDHVFGSFVLKEVGKIIARSIRETDFAARYGGDEFLIVLTDTSLDGTKMVTERIRKGVQDRDFNDGKNQIRLTCSIGYVVGSPDQIFDSKSLVRTADHALYESKEKGRNLISEGALPLQKKSA